MKHKAIGIHNGEVTIHQERFGVYPNNLENNIIKNANSNTISEIDVLNLFNSELFLVDIYIPIFYFFFIINHLYQLKYLMHLQ